MVAPEKSIDPDIVFQSFLFVSKIGPLDIEDLMEYELRAYPASIKKAKKA